MVCGLNRINGKLTTYSYDELTDLRRKLQKEIADLTNECGQQHIEIVLLNRKNAEEAKYAELGRLAMKMLDSDSCEGQYMAVKCKNYIDKWDCDWKSWCAKRAELLAEVQDGQEI